MYLLTQMGYITPVLPFPASTDPDAALPGGTRGYLEENGYDMWLTAQEPYLVEEPEA